MKLIENVKVLLLLLILATLVLGLFCLKGINGKLSNFYEFENKKINLSSVKYIQSRVDYTATLSQDKSEDIHRTYSTHFNMQEIEKIEKILELSKESDFYDIQINAFMMFDNEKINLFQSKRFIKLPTHYKVNPFMLSTLKTYGIDDFQYQNLLKLQGQEFSNKDEFVDTIIERAKFRRSDWLVANLELLGCGEKESEFLKKMDPNVTELLLDDNEMENIVTSLKSSYENYVGIK